jgi:hypothetical protein
MITKAAAAPTLEVVGFLPKAHAEIKKTKRQFIWYKELL